MKKIRIHFVNGDWLDMYSDYDDLVRNLQNIKEAKFINFEDTTVFIRNITYIEKIKEEE